MNNLLRLLLAGLIGFSSLIVPHRAAVAASGRATRAPRMQRFHAQDAQFEQPAYMSAAVQVMNALPDENPGQVSFLPARAVAVASLALTGDVASVQDDFAPGNKRCRLHSGRSPPARF
jgi:hypothetical protein